MTKRLEKKERGQRHTQRETEKKAAILFRDRIGHAYLNTFVLTFYIFYIRVTSSHTEELHNRYLANASEKSSKKKRWQT